MRLFVAVELDDAVRETAAHVADDLRQQLRGTALDARWVTDDKLHLTLVFIGQIGDGAASSFTAAIARPFDQEAFPLRLGRCGVFPPSGPPRVIWIGLSAGGEGLSRLQQEVVNRLQPLGFEPERRPFSAHLTIARVKDVPRAAARDVRAITGAARVPDASCLITRVTLFRSHLSPKGSRYEVMAHGELRGSSA